jgi:hypothetical protein
LKKQDTPRREARVLNLQAAMAQPQQQAATVLQLLLPEVMVLQPLLPAAMAPHHHQAVMVLRLLGPVAMARHHRNQAAMARHHRNQAAMALRHRNPAAMVPLRQEVVMALLRDGKGIFDYGGHQGNMIWILVNR